MQVWWLLISHNYCQKLCTRCPGMYFSLCASCFCSSLGGLYHPQFPIWKVVSAVINLYQTINNNPEQNSSASRFTNRISSLLKFTANFTWFLPLPLCLYNQDDKVIADGFWHLLIKPHFASLPLFGSILVSVTNQLNCETRGRAMEEESHRNFGLALLTVTSLNTK